MVMSNQFKEFLGFARKNPIPLVALVAACVVGGVLLGSHGQRAALGARFIGSAPKEAELPVVEVRMGYQVLKVQYAKSSVSQDIAWMRWVAGRPAPTLLEWDVPGRYPVLDVRPGWVVVWVKGGRVAEVRTPPEGAVNAMFPGEPYKYALVLPAADKPEGGTEVVVNNQTTMRLD
jgi:hypothetical protein